MITDNNKKLAQWAMDYALKNGCRAAKLVLYSNSNASFELRDAKMDKLQQASESGLSISLYVDGKYGSYSTNRLDKKELETFIKNGIESTRYLAVDEARVLPDASRYYKGGKPDLQLFDKQFNIINPDDKNAIEAALTLKDQTGCKTIVVTMGPPPAEGMLREIMAMGIDEAVLVSGREFGGSDTFATSQILAAAINKIGVEDDDIVLCGRQAIDGDTAQVGPQIAEKLNLPQVTYAADIKVEGRDVTVKRMLEDGYMTIKTQTPCLITAIKELNTPRYMSVGGIFETYSKPMSVFDFNTLKDDPLIELDTIGLKGSPTNIFASFTPPQKGQGEMLEGADQKTVDVLVDKLLAKHII